MLITTSLPENTSHIEAGSVASSRTAAHGPPTSPTSRSARATSMSATSSRAAEPSFAIQRTVQRPIAPAPPTTTTDRGARDSSVVTQSSYSLSDRLESQPGRPTEVNQILVGLRPHGLFAEHASPLLSAR